MIIGAHFLLYSAKPEEDRAFIRDILQFPSVDAGGGWLIFKLPPAEVGVHPIEDGARDPSPDPEMLRAELFLMCEDLPRTLKELAARGVEHAAPTEEGWGIRTTLRLPSGGLIGLYQAKHPTALGLI